MPIGCVSVTHEIFLYYAKTEPEAVSAVSSPHLVSQCLREVHIKAVES